MPPERSGLAVRRAQEAQATAAYLETVIYKRAVQDLVDLGNTLHSVISHARLGDQQARHHLHNFLVKLEEARALDAGIALPDNGQAPGG